MIQRPVRYDPQEQSIIDSGHNVICHPFHKIGLPDNLFHPLGIEIANCINAYVPEEVNKNPHGFIPESGQDGIVVPVRRRGRPSKR